MRRSAHDFYPAGVEIPQQSLDRYRCVDAATKNVLLTARRRIVVIMAALVVCFAVIIGRLFQLTIVDYHVRNFKPSVLRTQYETARKNIVDRNGIVLATSLPTVDLSVNPRLVKNPAEAARRLVEALPDLEYDDVYDKLSSPASFKYIKRNLTPKERNSVNWLGYYFLQETKGEKRAYPQGRLFAHILGATDIDNHGIAGLEKSYEAALQAGEVRLSLDTSVQEMTRQALQQGVQKYQAAGGLGEEELDGGGRILLMYHAVKSVSSQLTVYRQGETFTAELTWDEAPAETTSAQTQQESGQSDQNGQGGGYLDPYDFFEYFFG